jgi:hypothetical protein
MIKNDDASIFFNLHSSLASAKKGLETRWFCNLHAKDPLHSGSFGAGNGTRTYYLCPIYALFLYFGHYLGIIINIIISILRRIFAIKNGINF